MIYYIIGGIVFQFLYFWFFFRFLEAIHTIRNWVKIKDSSSWSSVDHLSFPELLALFYLKKNYEVLYQRICGRWDIYPNTFENRKKFGHYDF